MVPAKPTCPCSDSRAVMEPLRTSPSGKSDAVTRSEPDTAPFATRRLPWTG